MFVDHYLLIYSASLMKNTKVLILSVNVDGIVTQLDRQDLRRLRDPQVTTAQGLRAVDPLVSVSNYYRLNNES